MGMLEAGRIEVGAVPWLARSALGGGGEVVWMFSEEASRDPVIF